MVGFHVWRLSEATGQRTVKTLAKEYLFADETHLWVMRHNKQGRLGFPSSGVPPIDLEMRTFRDCNITKDPPKAINGMFKMSLHVKSNYVTIRVRLTYQR